jgi:hypothetical protein
MVFRSYAKGKCRRATVLGGRGTLRCAARKGFGKTIFLVYVNYTWKNIVKCIRILVEDT